MVHNPSKSLVKYRGRPRWLTANANANAMVMPISMPMQMRIRMPTSMPLTLPLLQEAAKFLGNPGLTSSSSMCPSSTCLHQNNNFCGPVLGFFDCDCGMAVCARARDRAGPETEAAAGVVEGRASTVAERCRGENLFLGVGSVGLAFQGPGAEILRVMDPAKGRSHQLQHVKRENIVANHSNARANMQVARHKRTFLLQCRVFLFLLR